MPISSASAGSHETRCGFTLIEVLVTVVILSIGIIMVLRALDASVIALGESRNSLLANMIMKERATSARLAALDGGVPSLKAEEGRFVDESNGFSGVLRLRSLDTSVDGSNTLFEARIEVQRKGRSRRYSATTFVCAADESR